MAILDEIDSGLDVDALQDVAKAVNGLLTPHNSILMITHYQRLLDYIKPKYVHIMVRTLESQKNDFNVILSGMPVVTIFCCPRMQHIFAS